MTIQKRQFYKLLTNAFWRLKKFSFLAKEFLKVNNNKYKVAILVDLFILFLIFSQAATKTSFPRPLLSPLAVNPLMQNKNKTQKQVFGFAPYWTFNKLDNVDFNVLTTLAYFGIPVNDDGTLDDQNPGYQTFQSEQATQLFTKAHTYGTRVVLTLSQMDNATIRAFLNDPNAQQTAINQAVQLVSQRGIDGLNIDFEYTGNPGLAYKNEFTQFVTNISSKMRQANPNATVTVSVYAASAKEPKLYDLHALAQNCDGIFMMAYDFAVAGADNAIPTDPLYGHKEGKYWYDISTAVSDFLTQMPADKLILGLPWYGYDYLVYQPEVKAETRPYYSWRGQPKVQTYSNAKDSITPQMDGILAYKSGWDNYGEVGWKAYYVAQTGTWRMVFLDDVKSLAIKYDFAKNKNLGGVGIWALGFDDGKDELWALLKEKFGAKLADAGVSQ